MRASSSAVGSWRTRDSSGNKAEIAAMIVAVSATASVRRQRQRFADSYGDLRRVSYEGEVWCTGRPWPHLLRPPDPHGDNHSSGRRGETGRARLSLEFGIEERVTAWDRALRQHDHHLARP